VLDKGLRLIPYLVTGRVIFYLNKKRSDRMETPEIRKVNTVRLYQQKGQALVEMAFVLPIMLLVLMGIFEFGSIFNTYLILTNASREGARVASVGGSDADVINSIHNATNILDPTKLIITIDPTEGNRSRGLPISVTATYNLNIISPIIDTIIPNPFPLSSKTVTRTE
jgi:uncharacterized protein (UPF0333 family)